MSHKRLTTWQKATALVPLALLSGAWTASLTVPTATSAVSATSQGAGTLPDGTTVPNQAIEAPASVSTPGSLAAGTPDGATQAVASGSSANGIPSAALAAYQRAEQVINSADPSCNMQWELIAAIGRVESDHGRYGGNTLNAEGKSTPGIFGIPLDGSNGTARITDSDAGQYDDDDIFDRAVGPMQFIPSTWSVVGVDGDGDGVRDPQDIDDAALASAVYLCSGDEDLGTTAGQRSSVYRYNHSQEYVDLVLSIMRSYLTGDYSAVPNGVATSPVLSPSTVGSIGTAGNSDKQQKAGGKNGGPRNDGGDTGSGTSTSGDTDGAVGGTGGDTGGGDTGDGDGSDPVPPAPEPAPEPVKDPVKETVEKVEDTVKDVTDGGGTGGSGDNDGGGGAGDAVENTLTKVQATAQCVEKGISKLDLKAMDACVDNLLS